MRASDWFGLASLLFVACLCIPAIVLAAEPTPPPIDPRIAAPALEAMQATIKLRDAQLTVMSERLKQVEAELQDARARLAPAPATPRPAE